MTPPDAPSSGGAPSATVVVPTYERPARLATCLSALAALEPPDGGFEVVVVDDGGSTPLDALVDRHRDRVDVTLLRQGNTGPAGARNAGAAVARGGLLAFTDDDCAPEPGWLVALVAAWRRTPDALLGGATRNGVDGDRCAAASQLLVDHVSVPDWSQPRFFPSNNLAVPATGFAEVGGFDLAFPRAAGEDRELCDRWASSGRPLVGVPEARVVHLHAFTLRSYWRQHHNYGRGAYRFHQLRAVRHGAPLRPEPPRFYGELLARPWRRREPDRLALSSLLALSQVANVAGFAAEWAAARRAGG